MTPEITLESVCQPSEDVVAREIEGELILVPIASGIGDSEDELYTLNETGKAIWMKLDGKHTVEQIASELSNEYEASLTNIERDVTGLLKELFNRKMITSQ